MTKMIIIFSMIILIKSIKWMNLYKTHNLIKVYLNKLRKIEGKIISSVKLM